MIIEHTPGPWKLLTDEEDRYYIGGGFYCVEVAEKRYIKSAGRSEKEANANARLIAAAPELLEALASLVEEFEKLPSSLGYEYDKLPQARAAVAKAKGIVE